MRKVAKHGIKGSRRTPVGVSPISRLVTAAPTLRFAVPPFVLSAPAVISYTRSTTYLTAMCTLTTNKNLTSGRSFLAASSQHPSGVPSAAKMDWGAANSLLLLPHSRTWCVKRRCRSRIAIPPLVYYVLAPRLCYSPMQSHPACHGLRNVGPGQQRPHPLHFPRQP